MPVKMDQPVDDSNDVVISGISGVFPNSDNVEEFKEHLLAGNDMISSNSRCNMEGVRVGLLKTIDRFDYSFFQITHVQAQGMLISSRILLEKTFEAILDAGYNPREIKGKNIAVICGIWDSVDEGDPAKDRKAPDYAEAFGRMRFMITNRISYWLDVHGPSYPINTACSASLYAIDHAIKAIQRGQCEGAIVCGTNFCFSKIEYLKNNPLFSATGNCAPFDADANGYVKSEAAVAFFLQRRKDARRIYANLIHSTTNSDGFKEEGTGCPSLEQQKKLYEQFYKEIDMNPQLISYIEAHGTGTQVGDVIEGSSIDQFFCTDRETPLKIGSVKSNMGHGEAAAALCGITKLIVAFESGTIPANLKYNKPNPKISGLFNGHLEVVSKPTPLQGQYFALNSFGVGGSNGHVLLSPHTKVKNKNLLDRRIPYLVTVSGRTEEAIDYILSNAQKNHHDTEFIRLLHEIFKYDINGHPQRGYIILQNNKTSKISKKFFSGEKRPIWFIFSGMGSQWATMGKSLMEIPIFAESIQKSHQILQSKGLNLMKIITEDDPQIFDNILNSFVGIAAIQIALVDILNKLNITPDGIIGHSVGELGCAYADGCFTAEQMILAAYYRGLVSVETDFIHGTMAAVGRSYESMKNHIPPEIDIACHNGPTSCTLSGPTQIMQDYIKKLNEQKIFVSEVKTSNIAYHSRYIASAGPKIISYLKKIIPEPKVRSDKWICTSAPEHKWNFDKVKYCSAEYHTNNLLSPVYFEECYKYIPNNAITIEIAPCGLLKAILDRSLPITLDNVPLLMKNHKNNVQYLLNAFGQLYEMGCDMEISHLYPPVEFPVSKSTPMISSLIKWRHDEQWQIDDVHSNFSQSSDKKFLFNPKSESTEYLRGHIIDGRNLYPGFGYLWMVIETVAMIENKEVFEVNVVFKDVRFEHAMTIPARDSVNFLVSVQQLYGYFEVRNNDSTLVTGKVRVIEKPCDEMVDIAPYEQEFSHNNIIPMNKKDFYKELRLRGYHYEGLFKQVEYFDYNRKYAEISWCNNFVCFLDMMLQVALILEDRRDLEVPTFIGKIVIDFKKHFEILKSLNKENPRFPVNFHPLHGLINSGGIQMSEWKFVEIARQKNNDYPILEKYLFVPYISDNNMNLSTAIRICVQIAIKNTSIKKVTTYELLEQEFNSAANYISYTVADALKYSPSTEGCVKLLINSVTIPETDAGIIISNETLPEDKSATLIILSTIQDKINHIKSILETLRDDGFIITKESINENIPFEDLGFNICFSRNINGLEKIILINKVEKKFKLVTKAVQLKNSSYSWISELQTALCALDPEEGKNLIIYAEKEPNSGIIGFFNSLKKEERDKNITCFFIMDNDAPKFSLDDAFYKSQYDKNLCCNVYKDGKWGSYWLLELNSENDVQCIHAFCKVEEQGNLSTFRWIEGSLDPNKHKNSNGKSLIFVHYNGLNFQYVMLSVGKIHVSDTGGNSNRITESNYNQGGEFSGKDASGVRVMGIAGEGITTMVESQPYWTWKVPDDMTLEEAASIPVVYSTVIYAFFVKMNLVEGCSVLIHSGCGGIGQAAINICLHYKCNIFTTVGTQEKVEFIKRTFPQIPENHVGNSRDTSFLKMIKEQTNGKGVDVVLNSLSGDKLLASIKCVAKCGHFLEIGKFDMTKNNSLGLRPFLKDITFHSVQLDILLSHECVETSIRIHNKLQEMLDQGIIKPINRTVYEMNEVESAIRYMASGKHIGKLIIKIRNEEQDYKTKQILSHFKAKPQVYFSKERSYVLLGGLGGFGMELADWLILRGARNIVLSSRTGIKNGYQSYRINLWRSYGATVLISTADISQESGVIEILELANTLGSVAGIFNLALILKDDLFLNQTEESFKIVTDPKAVATSHLDQISRKICPFLEHFVVFSSAMCCYGNSEQTNYGFGNFVMERICETRHADNIPALAIQWGVMGEVGLVYEISPTAIIGGLVPQKIKSCLETLNFFMKQKHPIVNSKIMAEKRKLNSDVISTVSNALGIKDLKSISLAWTLPELGLDSILTLELKQILEAELSIFLTSKDLQTMTFAKLYQLKKEKEHVQSSAHEVPKESQYFINEEVSNQPILRIPFIERKIQKQQPIHEIPTFFIFPGIEGLAFTMEPLAKNLPSQALCFQYHFVETENFYQNLIDYFSSYMLETLQPEQEFNFIGYSYGTMIAVEVGKILEKEGRKGRIWLIDGSPTAMQLGYKKKISENIFEKEDTWKSKKKLCFSLLSEVTGNENLKNRLSDQLHHLMETKYNSSHTLLNSPCVLIRCVQNFMDLPLDESYGLTEHFKNLVEVHKIDGADHSSIISHPKTAEIIVKSLPRKNFSTEMDKF